MSSPMSPEGQGTPTRPYLIRALHDWCTDNGFTPYLAVSVDATVQVPIEYVKNGEIVLNVGFDATSGLQMGNEFIEFKARFGGVARDILVPVDHVVAIYARENGQGMAFPAPSPAAGQAPTPLQSLDPTGGADEAPRDGQATRTRPAAPVISLNKDEPGRRSPASPERRGPADDPGKPPSGPRPTLKR
ncbi:MAG: ClpXP protease specificity-enhancing factor, partial [Rubrivivax sp.]